MKRNGFSLNLVIFLIYSTKHVKSILFLYKKAGLVHPFLHLKSRKVFFLLFLSDFSSSSPFTSSNMVLPSPGPICFIGCCFRTISFSSFSIHFYHFPFLSSLPSSLLASSFSTAVFEDLFIRAGICSRGDFPRSGLPLSYVSGSLMNADACFPSHQKRFSLSLQNPSTSSAFRTVHSPVNVMKPQVASSINLDLSLSLSVRLPIRSSRHHSQIDHQDHLPEVVLLVSIHASSKMEYVFF